MDGVFNDTVHSKPLNDVAELKSRISGLLLRIRELKAENAKLRKELENARRR